jgi:dTDP-D-glucose 4,6-dehydratase
MNLLGDNHLLGDKTKYMLLSCHQNSGQNHGKKKKIDNRLQKCSTDEIFGKDRNKSKFHSGGN